MIETFRQEQHLKKGINSTEYAFLTCIHCHRQYYIELEEVEDVLCPYCFQPGCVLEDEGTKDDLEGWEVIAEKMDNALEMVKGGFGRFEPWRLWNEL